MSYKPFYISSFENDSGLNRYLEPFLIPEKAFPELEDMYVWRGKVIRRRGFDLLGRLRRAVTALAQTNTQAGATYVDTDLLNSVRATEADAEIEPGTVVLKIDPGGANETIYMDNVTDGVLTYVSGTYTISAGSINYITGAVSLTFIVQPGAGVAVNASLSYYPALPVMGLRSRETTSVDTEQLIAFDMKYAYSFNGTEFVELVPGTTWNGTNSDFFWSTNYYDDATGPLIWVTNFNKGGTPDPIRYYNGAAWTTFAPTINGANEMHQCLLMIPFKNSLIAMNTWEGANIGAATQFPQRVRWSAPLESPADQVNAWRDDIPGRGGYIDMPTNESIVSTEFIKDNILIKCERSSWKLVYTGNPFAPFDVQKINAELGCESTFSVVPFDRGVFAVSNWGITTDDTVNVSRIDERIPDFIFNVNNDQDGIKRVHGIRDFTEQLVYWTFPDVATNSLFPNKILVYNYINSSYAIFNDSFTCFGYYQYTSDFTWATLPYPSWVDWTEPWNYFFQEKFFKIIGGNQQGYVEILNVGGGNDPSLSIIAITPGAQVQLTVPNHNLQNQTFIKLTDIMGIGSPNPSTLNGPIYSVVVVDDDNIKLERYNYTTEMFDAVPLTAGGTYIGGGHITVFNNINLKTKVFSPFYDQGDQVRVGYIDFFLNRTDNGEFTVQMFIDECDSLPINDTTDPQNSGLLGINIILTRPENLALIPFQANQSKIWHRLYCYAIAQNFQLQFILDNAQMSDEEIATADIIMHAMTLYLTPNARMVQ